MDISSLTDIKTVFDGWGTQLVAAIVAFIVGGGIYIYRKGKVSQRQKAGNYAKQSQKIKSSDEKEVSQSQEAGDNADQTQIG